MLYEFFTSKKGLIILFLLLSILPLTTLLLRESIIGVDGYAYINAICHNGQENLPIGDAFLANAFFGILPCSLVVFKLITWVWYLGLLIVLALLGYHFFGKIGLLAPLFAFLSSYWIVFPWEFENDFLATPFLWFSYWLFFKGKKLEAVLLVLATGVLVWGGAWIYLFSFGILYLPILIIALGVLIIKPLNILGTLLPNTRVAENQLFSGLASLLFLNIGWLGFKNSKIKQLLPLFIFGFVITILSGKYAYQFIPILCLGTIGFLELINDYWKDILIMVSLIMFVIVVFAGMPSTFPKFGMLENSKIVVNEAKDLNLQLYNDWDMGYYIEYYNYNVKYKGAPPLPDEENFINVPKNSLIFTIKDLNYEIYKNLYNGYKLYKS